MTTEFMPNHQNPLSIPELGIDVYFGKEPLRHNGIPNILNLVGEATQNHKFTITQALNTIARQRYIYRNPSDYNRHLNKKKDLNAIFEPMTFLESQTCLAIFNYGVNPNIDPYVFISNYSRYIPKIDELKANGFNNGDVSICLSKPAKLAGSMAICYFGYDDCRQTILIPRGDYYRGKWTIPGGHYDSPNDVAGLAEAVEEIGLQKDLLKKAEPLGIIDQVVFTTSRTGTIQLERYLNLVWTININDKRELHKYEKNGVKIDEEEINPEDMTPIAREALKMVGYF